MGGHVQTITSLAKTVALVALVIAAFLWLHPHDVAGAAAAIPMPHGLALAGALAVLAISYPLYRGALKLRRD